MKLSFNLTLEKVGDLAKTFLILSNVKRLKLLLLMKKQEPSSSAKIHQLAEKEKIYDNRETTYRALELLTQTDLISKKYDEEKKELVYFVKNENKS